MAVLKQLVVTVLVLAIAGAVWLKFDEAPGRYLLANDPGLPAPVMKAVSYLSPADDEQVADATGSGVAAPAAPGPRGGGRNGGPGSDATLVVTDAVTTATTRDRLNAIGTGEAEQSVFVYPDATGIIESVSFTSGAEVQAGQILATLQNAAERLALDRARIAAAAAEEKLARYQQLISSRTITAVEAQEVQRELDNARLDVRASQIALANRNIVAPISGRVGITEIGVGDLVNNQTLIATVDDRSQLKVIFYVPEAFVPALAIGHPVEAVSVGSPSDVYRGQITAIDSRLDEASRTLKIEATIDNPRDDLRPGMSFSLAMAFEGEDYLSVDPLAVQWERSGPFVWKVEGDEVTKSAIRIIERNVDRVLVAADNLDTEDRVVVEGLQSIREGTKVRAVPRNPAQVAPSELVSEEDAVPPASTPQARRIGQRGASYTETIAAEAAELHSLTNSAAAPAAARQAAALDWEPEQRTARDPVAEPDTAPDVSTSEEASSPKAQAASNLEADVATTGAVPGLPVPTPRSTVVVGDGGR